MIKLICIDNIWTGFDIEIDMNITIGKEYLAYYIMGDRCSILNDIGIKSWYKIEKFISIEEYRENQINKII